MDLGDLLSADVEQLNSSLLRAIGESAALLKIELAAPNAHERFRELILKAAAKEKVVILIDEYDKPILDNITNPQAESLREALASFYSVIKATEPYQRFVLMTGVSKFSQDSAFSKLNNLADISMDARFASMLGYTQEELESNFAERIDLAANANGVSREDLLAQLKEWYNGYRFEENSPTVYNPVSIAKFFEAGGKFKNFWFETGTPKFLIELLKKGDYDLPSLESLSIDETGFSAYEISNMAAEPLLFQTGYLTITGHDPETMVHTLGYPNREVKNAFLRHFLDAFTPVRKELAASQTHAGGEGRFP